MYQEMNLEVAIRGVSDGWRCMISSSSFLDLKISLTISCFAFSIESPAPYPSVYFNKVKYEGTSWGFVSSFSFSMWLSFLVGNSSVSSVFLDRRLLLGSFCFTESLPVHKSVRSSESWSRKRSTSRWSSLSPLRYTHYLQADRKNSRDFPMTFLSHPKLIKFD